MKKLLLILPIAALLATGCNSGPGNDPSMANPNQSTPATTTTANSQVAKPNPINPLLNQSNKMEIYKDDNYGFQFDYPATYTFETPSSTDINDVSFSHMLKIFAPGQGPMFITIRSQPLDISGKIYNKVDDIVPQYVNTPIRPTVKYIAISGIRAARLYWKKDTTNLLLFIYNGFVYEINYQPIYQTLIDSLSLK